MRTLGTAGEGCNDEGLQILVVEAESIVNVMPLTYLALIRRIHGLP